MKSHNYGRDFAALEKLLPMDLRYVGLIGPRKRRALLAAAAEYRALAEWRGPVRFAVVCVTVSQDGELDAELVEDPFC